MKNVYDFLNSKPQQPMPDCPKCGGMGTMPADPSLPPFGTVLGGSIVWCDCWQAASQKITITTTCPNCNKPYTRETYVGACINGCVLDICRECIPAGEVWIEGKKKWE